MYPITTPAPLQSLRERFDQCRSIGKRAVFPEELKRQAVRLSSEYPSTAVVNALAISPTSLSRWKRQLDGGDCNLHFNPEAHGPFVTLPLVEPCKTQRHRLSIVLSSADSDHNVTLSGEVTRDQWSDILDQISSVLLS